MRLAPVKRSQEMPPRGVVSAHVWYVLFLRRTCLEKRLRSALKSKPLLAGVLNVLDFGSSAACLTQPLPAWKQLCDFACIFVDNIEDELLLS